MSKYPVMNVQRKREEKCTIKKSETRKLKKKKTERKKKEGMT